MKEEREAMEGGNGASKGKATAAPTCGGGGASQYLVNLPSRGLFSSTVLSSNPGGMRVYICEHDTSPPADQKIKTNQTNILIRSLTLKKQKNDCNSKEVKVKATTNARGKRSAERTGDGSSAKKANIAPAHSSIRQEGSSSRSSVDLQGLTVERLRILLKERGLSTKGKKDELIGRLKNDRELIARTRNDQEDDGDCSL